MRVGIKRIQNNKNIIDKSNRSIKYAINQIKRSSIAPYVNRLILYGSCARNQQTISSDVDLLLELKEGIEDSLHSDIIKLKSLVNSKNIDDAEVDMKVVIGNKWENNKMLYYKNIKREGKDIWNMD